MFRLGAVQDALRRLEILFPEQMLAFMTKMCLKQKRSGMAKGLNGPQTDKVHIFCNILLRCMTVKIN